jgi:HAD superfamily hydrolase (TIGR01458 family)
MQGIKKIFILIDFDGIIRIGKKIAEDAKVFLTFLKDKEIPHYIISNSTLNTSKDIKLFLKQNGVNFDVNAMTTVDAALQFVNKNKLKISIYCEDTIKNLFKDFINDANPDAVVIGDIGREWSYEVLNKIFHIVMNGADIIALQKNKFWNPDGKGLVLDAGAFISAIEYATNRQSILIGKPSEIYFKSALDYLGYKNGDSFYMIGDDLETDIVGSEKIGGKGILVFSGKTKFPLSDKNNIRPSYIAKNLTGVIEIIKNIT